MPFFHATWAENLPGIIREGLLPEAPRRNLPCEPGVYLAEDPVVAVAMLLDAYAEAGAPESSPSERAGAVRVIVVDDARVDPSALRGDPHFEGSVRTWLHAGRLHVAGSAVLTLADLGLEG